MAKAKDSVYIATESGSCEVGGESLSFTKGVTRVRAGHALLDAVPDYFEPVGDHVHYDTETASTAATGRRET